VPLADAAVTDALGDADGCALGDALGPDDTGGAGLDPPPPPPQAVRAIVMSAVAKAPR
jgi:hypothetical protein